MNINNKTTIIIYHLAHNNNKVINKIISNKLKCSLFNKNHDALLKQKRFVIIITSGLYLTWVKKVIRKNEFNKIFDQEKITLINVRTKFILYNVRYDVSFITWNFFY